MRVGARLWLALVLSFFTAGVVLADTPVASPDAPSIINGIDVDELGRRLASEGLTGWIHGAAHDLDQYVFTYRDSDDFFKMVQLSIVPATPAVLTALRGLRRNDEVFIRGEFKDNPSAQKHIWLTEVQLVKKFDPGIHVKPYEREVKLPDELLGKSQLVGSVHAVVADGQILVIEYKDAIVPVFVRDNTTTKTLYRGDVVRLSYRVLKIPKKPTHLLLDTRAPHPVEVLDAIVKHNGEPTVQTGNLVLFPRSPEIIFDVFALQVELPSGIKRNFTLVNFTDPDVFKAIRAKLKAAWDQHPEGVVDNRNKFLNTKVKVRAKGIFNEVSPSQANPQILLEKPEDIEILPAAP